MNEPKVSQKYREWLTVSEYAEITRQSIATAYRHAERGVVPSKKFGRAVRIPASAVIPET